LSLRAAGAELRASTEAMQLVMTLSKLLFGAFMLFGGLLGDTYGRRRVLLLGCTGVVGASALGAVSANAAMLAIARGLDGVANAAIGPLALALVIDIFPGENERSVGMFIGLSALGIAFGPLFAGLVVQALGWRVGMCSPALVAVVGGLLVRMYAPESRGMERRRLDGVGALVVAVALLAVVFAVVGGSSAGWSNPRVRQALAVGASAFLAFVWWERRVEDPLLDLTLFKSRALNAALVTGTLVALVIGGAILPLLYFYQNVHGLGPVPGVMRIVPLVLVAAAAAGPVGKQLERHGPRPVIIAGLLAIAAGCGILAFLEQTTPYPLVLLALALLGAGDIAVITPVTDIVLKSVPAERSGSAAALNNAAMQVGGALGAAVLTSVFFAAARADYAMRMRPTGISVDKLREITRAWRKSLADQASMGAKILPEGLEQRFEESFNAAFTLGVARVFLVGAFVALACLALVLFGVKKAATTRAATPR
jgi:MFS family permease